MIAVATLAVCLILAIFIVAVGLRVLLYADSRYESHQRSNDARLVKDNPFAPAEVRLRVLKRRYNDFRASLAEDYGAAETDDERKQIERTGKEQLERLQAQIDELEESSILYG